MERLQALPDTADFFSFTRRYVGNAERTLRAMPLAESFKSFELWVGQALAALAKLHEAGFLHGSIDPSTLVINEDGNLRLGGLQKVREDVGSVGNVETEEFNPTNLTSPPEYNLYTAFRASIPFQRAYDSLMQANWILDQLQTAFPSFHPSRAHMFALYEKVQSPAEWSKMQQASDVFMLGVALLTVYYEMLERWSFATSSEFYQTKHEALHDLIEEMTRFQPDKRITASDALMRWAPSVLQPLLAEPSLQPLLAEPSMQPLRSEPSLLAEPSLQPLQSESVQKPSRRGLILQSHLAGRNRTRRNPRN